MAIRAADGDNGPISGKYVVEVNMKYALTALSLS
jgi:hypothetical protein